MNISKTQKGLLALPLLVGGIIGIAALASNHISAAPTQQAPQSQTAPSDKPEASDPADTNEPAKNSPDTDNIQDGPQNGAQDKPD